jgi:hypothetical protein
MSANPVLCPMSSSERTMGFAEEIVEDANSGIATFLTSLRRFRHDYHVIEGRAGHLGL